MLLLAPYLLLTGFQAKPTLIDQPFGNRVTVSVPIMLHKVEMGPPPAGTDAISDVWSGDTGFGNVQVCIFSQKNPKPLNAATSLTEILDGILEGHTAIVGDRDIVNQGWQGIAVASDIAGGHTAALRAFCCGDAVVTVGCLYRSNTPRPPVVDQVLDSIRFATAGPAKQAGILFARFPLGKSGASALFPSAPDGQSKHTKGGPTKGDQYGFTSRYGFRTFVVSYKDVPPGSNDGMTATDKTDVYVQVCNDTIRTLEGKKVKADPCTLGQDTGLRTEFTTAVHEKGTVIAFFHGPRLFILLALAPASYSRESLEGFFHSVEFGK